MKNLLISLFLLTSICIAEEKVFQDDIYPESRVLAPCARAADILYAVPTGTTCTFLVKMRLFQKPGADLIRLAKLKKYHPISFWVEERVENKEDVWKKVTTTRLYRLNDIYQSIRFKPTKSAIFRVAIDYQGQKAFQDITTDEYKVTVK